MCCHSGITSLGRFALEHITGAHAGPPVSPCCGGTCVSHLAAGVTALTPGNGSPCPSNRAVIVWSGKVISQH